MIAVIMEDTANDQNIQTVNDSTYSHGDDMAHGM